VDHNHGTAVLQTSEGTSKVTQEEAIWRLRAEVDELSEEKYELRQTLEFICQALQEYLAANRPMMMQDDIELQIRRIQEVLSRVQ
jgi:hypothetical protein